MVEINRNTKGQFVRKYPVPANSNIYRLWAGMINRCYKPAMKNYPIYGGRGITVDREWLFFENFWNDIGYKYKSGLTLDRIDNNGNYCKKNCRWASRKLQANNRRNNVYLTYKGQTRDIAQWSEFFKVPHYRIYSRYIRGWDINRIMETPFNLVPQRRSR